MEIKCNSLLEAPIMNLIMLHNSLNTKGVCGIITPGTQNNVNHTSISSLALLSYCNELEVSESFDEKLGLIDISLAKGGISYQSIADASGGMLTVPKSLDSKPFTVATDSLSFRILLGKTTSDDVLLEEDLYNKVSAILSKEEVFTSTPMPLLNKKLPKFSVKRDSGVSHISSNDIPPNIVEIILNSITVL